MPQCINQSSLTQRPETATSLRTNRVYSSSYKYYNKLYIGYTTTNLKTRIYINLNFNHQLKPILHSQSMQKSQITNFNFNKMKILPTV